jgi:hypothetical protein
LSEDKGFLSRWSDRKLQADAEDSEKAPDALPAETAETAENEFEGKSDEEILSILELPEPETLKLGDTVEKFMDGRVPERIRARALRAFWKTNPVLANIDGLDEYCDDYTDAAMIIENMQTIYEVGKGYATQALDALESLADDGQAEATESVDKSIAQSGAEKIEVSDSPAHDGDSEADSGQAEVLLAEDDATAEPIASVEPVIPRPRRMQFQ